MCILVVIILVLLKATFSVYKLIPKNAHYIKQE